MGSNSGVGSNSSSGQQVVVPPRKPFRQLGALVAGNNIITHNHGSAPVGVEVRNNANGATITHRIVAETVNTVTIFLTAAVASARVTVL
jgi:hypothetical protein